jgi:tetratricopeptide (TPR) repeat protein
MKRPMLCAVITGLSLVVAGAEHIRAAETDELFITGNTLYQAGSYREATDEYEKILALGYHSWEVYYNIGNAHFKQGNVGRAILNYERAKRLEPKNEDIDYNLEFANLATVDRIQKLPRFFLTAWLSDLAHWASARTLAIVSVSLYFILSAVVALFILVPSGRMKRTLVAAALTLGVLLLFFSSLLLIRIFEDETTVAAIVLSDKVDVRSAPDELATEVFVLHEGVKVQIQDSSLQWVKVRLPDGKVGWMTDNHLERI